MRITTKTGTAELRVISGRYTRQYRDVSTEYLPPLVLKTLTHCLRNLRLPEYLEIVFYLDRKTVRRNTYGCYWENLWAMRDGVWKQLHRIEIAANREDADVAFTTAHEFAHAQHYRFIKPRTSKKDREGYADAIAALVGLEIGFKVSRIRRVAHHWDVWTMVEKYRQTSVEMAAEHEPTTHKVLPE